MVLAMGMLVILCTLPLSLAPRQQLWAPLGSQAVPLKLVGHFDTQVGVCPLGLLRRRLLKPGCLGTWTSALLPCSHVSPTSPLDNPLCVVVSVLHPFATIFTEDYGNL